MHPDQQCVWISVFHFLPNVCHCAFLIIAVLASEKWGFIVLLICTSLVANKVEQLFVCLLAICTSFHKIQLSLSVVDISEGLV